MYTQVPVTAVLLAAPFWVLCFQMPKSFGKSQMGSAYLKETAVNQLKRAAAPAKLLQAEPRP